MSGMRARRDENTGGDADRSAYLILLIPPLLWAGNFVVGRAIQGDITPVALTFWRWALAACVLLPLAGRAMWRARASVRREWRLLTMLALSGVVGFQYVVYQGLRSTTAINGVLIIASVPAVIPLFAYGLDRSRISVRQMVGIAVSMLGVVVIVLRGDPAAALDLHLAPGDLWISLAVPMWALYSVLVRRRPDALSPLALLLAIVLFGLAALVPAYLLEFADIGGFRIDPPALAAIAYVGVGASVLAFWCWNRGVAGVGASKAGLYLHLMPVFAALLATVFLGERIHPYHGLGVILIGAGLYLSSTARSGRS
ncbi:MAG: DMT family transporter [Rhodospirillales bacterium]|nr:DMT family transporter [Rhodospirillales bacterium]